MTLVKRTLLALGVAALALGGCSSSDERSPAVAESSPEETGGSAPAQTGEVEQVALVDVCSEVETAVSETMGDGATVAGVGDYQVLRGRLQALAETADVQAEAGLAELVSSVDDSIDALGGGASTAVLDARSATRDGIGDFADECALVGSSALQ